MCEYFGATVGLTVDCNFTCGKVEILGFGVVSLKCIGEIFCCVVVFTVVKISSFAECDGVWVSCFVRFLVPFRFSCCMRV